MGTSLAVLWLRLHASTPGDIPLQEMGVWSLVSELRSHMLCGRAKKKIFLRQSSKKKKKIQTVKCISIALRVCYLCRYKKEKEVKARLGRDDNSWIKESIHGNVHLQENMFLTALKEDLPRPPPHLPARNKSQPDSCMSHGLCIDTIWVTHTVVLFQLSNI